MRSRRTGTGPSRTRGARLGDGPVFRLGANTGNAAVDFRSDEIVIDLSAGRAGRGIAAAMKNAIQAGIRAIREPASQATLARRQGEAAAAAELWLSVVGKRKRRARKHLTGGTYANATGNLADNLRVTQHEDTETSAIFSSDAPPDRLNEDDFAPAHYLGFRGHLLDLVPALADASVLWATPIVQRAIERAIRAQTTIKKAVR